MEICKFNDPEPLRPFLRVLQNNAPHLVNGARRLLASNNESSRNGEQRSEVGRQDWFIRE